MPLGETVQGLAGDEPGRSYNAQIVDREHRRNEQPLEATEPNTSSTSIRTHRLPSPSVTAPAIALQA
jgi:hypothetical protein